jgi:hypothetical protein
MNQIAERYVKLCCQSVSTTRTWLMPITAIRRGSRPGRRSRSNNWRKTLRPFAPTLERCTGADEGLDRLRRTYLDKQLSAIVARSHARGNKLFDDEAARLYDAQPPMMTEKDFQPVLDEPADSCRAPGPSSIMRRSAKFVIPTDKLDAGSEPP